MYILLTIIGSIAELESDLIRERVLAGMRSAKLDGVRIGRAPMNPVGQPSCETDWAA
jgi:DNA invertase Pin-like site-specific DNA recombinase